MLLLDVSEAMKSSLNVAERLGATRIRGRSGKMRSPLPPAAKAMSTDPFDWYISKSDSDVPALTARVQIGRLAFK